MPARVVVKVFRSDVVVMAFDVSVKIPRWCTEFAFVTEVIFLQGGKV